MKTNGGVQVYSTIFYLRTRWKWVISFTLLPLYPRGNSLRYPLDMRLGGHQSRSGRCRPYRATRNNFIFILKLQISMLMKKYIFILFACALKLTSVNKDGSIFWSIKPWNLAELNRRFRGTYYLHCWLNQAINKQREWLFAHSINSWNLMMEAVRQS
jgi:hypothetical protein